jgi:G3E family GTPase
MLRLIPLGGYLGAGKTTTMLTTAAVLQQRGEWVAVITNDQGTELVDTDLATSRLPAVGEVTGGCFCCRFEDLAEAIVELRSRQNPTVVITEAVGSRTDLQSTVIRPLRHHYGHDLSVAPLTVVVDPLRYQEFARALEYQASESDLGYLYRLQLAEADVLALNKLDLIGHDEANRLAAALRALAGEVPVVAYSALRREGIDQLIELWTAPHPASDKRIDVDYERYAAAEAQLGWANLVLDVRAATPFPPGQWIHALLQQIAHRCQQQEFRIGHVKIALLNGTDIAKGSILSEAASPQVDMPGAGPVHHGRVTINARVACTPSDLRRVLEEATGEVARTFDCQVHDSHREVFTPARPVPTHRM